MQPQAFQHLWKQHNNRFPHLDHHGYQQVCNTSAALTSESDNPHFWGLISDSVIYRGHPIFRCYNFGTLKATYPWQAKLANFGLAINATITMAGTLRPAPGHGTLLDSLTKPYLVFQYEAASHVTEFVQPGLLIGNAQGRMSQRRQFDIVMPDGSPPPETGVLYYFLMKRLGFSTQPETPWAPPGAAYGLPRAHITVAQPICVAAGWPLLLLARGRWVWAVVAS